MRTAILLAATTLTGCSALFAPLPDHASRRQAYVDANPGIQQELRDLILNGRVAVGMHAEHVIASWGDPLEKDRFVSASGVTETWTYGKRRRTNPGPSGFSYIDTSYILRLHNGVVESFYSP